MTGGSLAAGVAAGVVIVVTTLAAVLTGGTLGAPPSTGDTGTGTATGAAASIPPRYLALYRAAAETCPGLSWTVLAGVGEIETDHGRSTLPGVHSGQNRAGAQGPMQFLPDTFAAVVRAHPPPAGGAVPPSPFDPSDAIYTAAMYLCDNGARGGIDLRGALFTYNRSESYVDAVLAAAARYARGDPAAGPDPRGAAPAQALTPGLAGVAVVFALSQLGRPYVWGGNGPAGGDAGFDCSGLTVAAYAAAGITLPRTALTQYRAGPVLPAGAPILPGDLVFYGSAPGGGSGGGSVRVHHVGIALGDGRMVHAPDVGDPVQIGRVRWSGDDYLGATRPAPPPSVR